jgi:thioredoxin-related protein
MNNLTRFGIVAVLAFLNAVTARADWQTDYNKALATAKAENKRVFINFTGSDWCGPCIAMHERVFSKKEFMDYADKNLVLVEIDYPKTKVLPEEIKKQNERLKYQFGINKKGFPTIALVDPSGKVLGDSTGYDDEGPIDIIARIEKWAKSQ